MATIKPIKNGAKIHRLANIIASMFRSMFFNGLVMAYWGKFG
jgi:hypothetical protein